MGRNPLGPGLIRGGHITLILDWFTDDYTRPCAWCGASQPNPGVKLTHTRSCHVPVARAELATLLAKIDELAAPDRRKTDATT